MILKGAVVKIEDRIAKLQLAPDEKLLMVHFNVRTAGAYNFLTRGYLQDLGVLCKNETLLDRVTSITLEKDGDIICFGCSGDCQPNLTYASPWSILQDFIDFFSQIEKADVRISVCHKTLRPETTSVTLQEYKSAQRPTGKMRTSSSCS